jgi:hypothetical protein
MAASSTGHGHTWVFPLTKPLSGSEVFAVRGIEIITASTACARAVPRQRPALTAVIIAQVVVTRVAPRLRLLITLSACRKPDRASRSHLMAAKGTRLEMLTTGRIPPAKRRWCRDKVRKLK